MMQEVSTVASNKEDEGDDKDKDDTGGDDTESTHGENDTTNYCQLQPRWTTRAFAVVLLRKVVAECCQGDR